GTGMGLGLAVSYGIVQNHNGEIEVKSKVGEGTTFTVRLPLVQPSKPAA
ncbi:MAG: HAMP domain-containing histidine kinase, partial [Deltaproteobacteria bacterium]|nr:HAMP domain-containing histidine kinase [Deltaproteobacteria bacterium]